MSEERKRILEMLEQRKINTDEAERLLDALSDSSSKTTAAVDTATEPPKSKPRYLRVCVKGEDEDVDIRVPFQLIRAGIKLGSIIPKDAMGKVNSILDEKGINLNLSDLMKPEAIEDLVEGMSDLKVEVNGADEKVRIFCE